MLAVTNIAKSFGDQVLFSGVTFNVGARDRVAVIGPNGCGKTTLFEILVGNISPDSGSVAMRKDITIGYAKQEITPESYDLLLDHVAHASNKIAGLEHRIKKLQEALAEGGDEADPQELMQELGELQHKYEQAGGYNIEHEAEVILCGLGFKEKDFQRPLKEFSGGWLMRITLAKLLVINPDLLLLDEPTNHLDLESCLWFENYLRSYQGAVLLTSHDRAFLNRMAQKIIAIEKDDVLYFQGTYDEFVEARKQSLLVLESTARRQDIKINKEMRFINRFRSQATKASAVQSRIKALAKVERVVIPRNTKKIHFTFPEPPRSGDEVITLKHVAKAYEGNVIYRDLNLTLRRKDRVALVGLNGAGKTTLLKILAGVLPFEGGERKLGQNVTTAYYAQYQLELLDPKNTVIEELRKVAADESEQRLRALLGTFLFSGDDAYKKVAVLSGGEKGRLSIAKMLVRPANFLLMDEPTNHLDINSREMLSDALDAYHGTLCFITHDRTIIRDIADKIIEIRNGEPVVYQGNYDEYLDWKAGQGLIDTPTFKANGRGPSGDAASRDAMRQRKVAEGTLRNTFSRESSALKRRIDEIETELHKLEAEYRDLESSFANPESYADALDIKTRTMRHHELQPLIAGLTQEWEQCSQDYEQKKEAFEQAKKDLAEEY